jgi:hypothetical protein
VVGYGAVAAAGTGHVKGVLLVHLREYVVTHRGDGAWDSALARIKAGDPEVWSGLVLSSSWYPVGAWNRAFDVVVRTVPDPIAEVRKIAYFVSERDIHSVFRMLLRIAPPEFVLGRTGMFWSRYFDVGTLRPAKLGERRWEIALDAPVGEDEAPGTLTCVGVCGWLERALAMTGTNGAKAHHGRCRFIGGTRCHFDVTW